MNGICLVLDLIFDEEEWKKSHKGIVSGMIPAGAFVTTENGFEGLIPTRKLEKRGVYPDIDGTRSTVDIGSKDNKFFRRKMRKMTQNKKGGKRRGGRERYISIGDPVIVRAKRFCIEKGQLDLDLIRVLG